MSTDAMEAEECVVYWLHDATCSRPEQDGYVGITTRLDARLRGHRIKRAGKGAFNVPMEFQHKVLFTGSIAECVAMEAKLRPTQEIGWNLAKGGRQPYLGHKLSEEHRAIVAQSAKARFKGVPKSAEQRAKMSAAAKKRYANPDEPRPIADYWRGKDRSGENNPRFKQPVSVETREKIGKANFKPVCKRGHVRVRSERLCPECNRINSRLRYEALRAARDEP